MAVLEKLTKIQSELKAPKSQFNKFGNYKYRNCEDILEALKPILFENHLAIILDDDIDFIEGRYYIKATATLYDTEDNSQISNTAFAREEDSKKGMDGSQITGASSSYARKYALNGMFAIDDTKDSDTTNIDNKSVFKKGQPKQKEIETDNDKLLKEVKKEIISICTILGGTKNKELMATLKSYVASGNPNGIKDLDKAKECLAKIKTIKSIE